ncbi:25508_t:CDS:2, partial [Gigaspora rosea]
FKTFEVNDEETWKTEKDEKYGNERKDGLKVSASKPGKSCLKHGKGRVKDDNNGEVITEMKGLNCTIYGGDGIEKANEVNDIVNKEWEEHELNDVEVDKEVHDYLRDSAHMNGSMKNVVEINKVEYHCQNMSRVIRDETYGWRMGSAEGANSTGKFDPDDEVRNNKINALFPYRKFAKMKLAEKMHNVDSCFDYEIGGSKISVEVSELEYAFWYRLTKEETPTSSWQYNNGNCYEGDKEHRLTNQSLSDIDAINRPYDLEPCYKGKSRSADKDFVTERNDADKIEAGLGKLEVDVKIQTNKIKALLQYKKAADTKHVDKRIRSVNRNAMKIEKGTLVDYQKSVERDERYPGIKGLNSLEKCQQKVRDVDVCLINIELVVVNEFNSSGTQLRDQFRRPMIQIVEDMNKDVGNNMNNGVV